MLTNIHVPSLAWSDYFSLMPLFKWHDFIQSKTNNIIFNIYSWVRTNWLPTTNKKITPLLNNILPYCHLKMQAAKPPLVSQQCLVYKFEWQSLCNAGCVGYTSRHLHPWIEEHKVQVHPLSSSFMLNILQQRKIFSNNFSILKKCKSKFDCLVFEMFSVNELRPSLNVQPDSFHANAFK